MANGKWFVAVQCMHSERILKEKLEMLRDFLEEIRRSEASEANGRTDRRGEARKRHKENVVSAQRNTTRLTPATWKAQLSAL
jgi:hypothetical protein